MRKTYQHIFPDDSRVTVSISTEGDRIAVGVDPQIVPLHLYPEFLRWRDEVLMPDLMESLDPEHLAALTATAVTLFGGQQS